MASKKRRSFESTFDLNDIKDVLKDYEEPIRRITKPQDKFGIAVTIKTRESLKLNKGRPAFERQLRRGGETLALALKRAMDKNVTDMIWQWSYTGSPRYRSYDPDSFPSENNQEGLRDIVDTGKLLNSNRVKYAVSKTGLTIRMYNNADYARFVHFGAYIHPWGNKQAAKVYLPARPWLYASINYTGTKIFGERAQGAIPRNSTKVDVQARLNDIYARALKAGYNFN